MLPILLIILSLINGKNNSKIGKDIPVERYHAAIAVDEDANVIYVANDEIKGVTPLGGGCFTPLPLAVCDEQVLHRWESQAQTTLS
jgi:DNA-binding beta-propeller fold protein YncE